MAITKGFDSNLQQEDFASGHGSLQVIDEFVVPSDSGHIPTSCGDSTGTSVLPEGVAPLEDVRAVSVGKKRLASFERLENDRSLGRETDKPLVADPEHDRHEHIEDTGSKECQPESNVVLVGEYQFQHPVLSCDVWIAQPD